MSAAQSQSQTALLPPRSYWSVKQAGRGRKLKSRRGARDGGGGGGVEGGRRMREKVVARAGKSEGAKESPDKSLC